MTREKLEGLFARRWPEPERGSVAWVNWSIKHKAFKAFLSMGNRGTDEAFLAAAMMCRLESVNHWPQYTWISTNPNNPVQKERVEIWTKGCRKPFRGEGPTPAEALIEAIEKEMNDE